MPYRLLQERVQSADAGLVAALAEELRRPPVEDEAAGRIEGPAGDAPEITEERTLSGPVHVTVVWDRWQHLSGEARGRVILEAYRQAQGEEAMRRITIALGLTGRQAERFGGVLSAAA